MNNKLKEDYTKLKLYLGILEEQPCTEEESEQYKKLLQAGQSLPPNVHSVDPYNDGDIECFTFYTLEETKLSPEDQEKYVQYKQLRTLITIKNCMLFFTILSITSIIGAIISLIIFLLC